MLKANADATGLMSRHQRQSGKNR